MGAVVKNQYEVEARISELTDRWAKYEANGSSLAGDLLAVSIMELRWVLS